MMLNICFFGEIATQFLKQLKSYYWWKTEDFPKHQEQDKNAYSFQLH